MTCKIVPHGLRRTLHPYLKNHANETGRVKGKNQSQTFGNTTVCMSDSDSAGNEVGGRSKSLPAILCLYYSDSLWEGLGDKVKRQTEGLYPLEFIL